MTYEDIIKHMPDEYKRRDADKFRYRYPRGESYEVRHLKLQRPVGWTWMHKDML